MSLNLFFGNYNIDAQVPAEPSLLAKHWLQAHLFPSEAKVTGTPPSSYHIDIYVLGLQEVKHFKDDEDPLVFETTNQDIWAQALLAAANWRADGTEEQNPFSLLSKVIYSSIMLVVLARKSLLEPGASRSIEKVQVMTHKLHDAGMTGKKGVAGVEFEVVQHDSTRPKVTVALMTAHFQAYSEKLDERLWDADQVVSALPWASGISTNDHSAAIIVGDLNYRIVLPIDEVKERIANNDLVPLLKGDELYNNTKGVLHVEDGHEVAVEKPVFVGWKESPILFKPTYKFVNGTDRWDDSGKQRTPAWCDRVLTHGSATTHYYTSASASLISDHKPILALVSIPLP